MRRDYTPPYNITADAPISHFGSISWKEAVVDSSLVYPHFPCPVFFYHYQAHAFIVPWFKFRVVINCLINEVHFSYLFFPYVKKLSVALII
jgi:hypothetical protein